jgi:hypothetical protein
LSFCRIWIGTQKDIQRHQNARRTKPALQRVVTAEGRLQDRQPVRRRRETFDGTELAAFYLDGERQACACQHAVDGNRTCAAHAMFASDVSPRRADFVTQKISQQHAWLGITFYGLAV